MTGPQALAQLLAAAEAGAIPCLARKIAWRRYPALFTLLASEAIGHTCTAHAYGWAVRSLSVPRTLVRAWAVVEVFRFACLRIPKEKRGRVLALSAAAALLLAGASNPFGSIGGVSAWLQVVCLAEFGALTALAVYLRRHPVSENRDHKAYRLGLLVWLAVLAVVGCFGYGGIGRQLFTRGSWAEYYAFQALNYGAYSALLVNLGRTVYRMASVPNIQTAGFCDEDPILQAFRLEVQGLDR